MKVIRLLFLFLLIFHVTRAQVRSDNQNNFLRKKINSGWTFNYFPGNEFVKGCESVTYNDSKWQTVSVPHTWVLYETTGDLFPFNYTGKAELKSEWWTGWGIYRKHFSISREYSDKKVFIEFGGVQQACKAFINGKQIADLSDAKKPFYYDITNFVKPGEDNVLVVAVNNIKGLSDATDNSDRMLFSGITGDVTVILRNRLFIAAPSTEDKTVSEPQVTGKDGIAKVTVWIKNDFAEKKDITMQATITDASGKLIQVIKSAGTILPGQSSKIEKESREIKNFHAWSVSDPYTYKVQIDVMDGKQISDSRVIASGLKFGKVEERHDNADGNWFLAGVENELKIKTRTEVSDNKIVVGEPVRINLSCNVNSITADKASLVAVKAAVVDKDNNQLKDINRIFRWNISGPGTFAGPTVYESNPAANSSGEGWNGGLPFANIIRSSGKPGVIHVHVSAAGMISGSFDITATEIKTDNPVISEPVLNESGRRSASMNVLENTRLDETPMEIKTGSSDLNFPNQDAKGLHGSVRDYIFKNNPAVDTTNIEFRILEKLLSSCLLYNKGQLSAFDYNYNIDNYNNCRLISGYINATKLPAPFKDGLRLYYAENIIWYGHQLNAGDEMNWLNWIPSGGTVVYYSEEKKAAPVKGTLITDKSGLTDIITLVHPVFSKYSDEAKERAIVFISKMNPYVHNLVAEKGKPVLVPLLKFIAE